MASTNCQADRLLPGFGTRAQVDNGDFGEIPIGLWQCLVWRESRESTGSGPHATCLGRRTSLASVDWQNMGFSEYRPYSKTFMQTIKQLPKSGFSILRVLLNLLLFSGGLLIGILLLGVLSEVVEVDPETLGYGALTIGGVIGGLFATRCSPRPMLKEAFSTVVVMAILGHILMRSGGNGLFSESQVWVNTAKMGCPSVLGILVGTLLGLKHYKRFRGPIDSGWRWSGISLLIASGVLLAGWFTHLLVSDTEGSSGAIIGACLVGTLLSGGITQLLAPTRKYMACGAGAVWLILIFAGIGITVNPGDAEPGSLIVGGIFLGGITLGVGTLGAFLAYKIAGRNEDADYEKISDPQSIPNAQAVDRG